MEVAQSVNYWDEEIMKSIARYLEPIIAFSAYFDLVKIKDS